MIQMSPPMTEPGKVPMTHITLKCNLQHSRTVQIQMEPPNILFPVLYTHDFMSHRKLV